MLFNPFAMIAALGTASTAAADISTFTSYATEVLAWLVQSFGTVLNFMLANPICFVWLIVSLIGVAFVFLRRTIGG